MSDNPFRVYLDPAEIHSDGYPIAWHYAHRYDTAPDGSGMTLATGGPVKDLVRELAGHRCERCGHPYRGGGEWTACDEECRHFGPVRISGPQTVETTVDLPGPWKEDAGQLAAAYAGSEIVEARWRILTVHHLNGIKHDLRWWNLVALCQRCHLSVQGRVVMERIYPWEHSEWFKPYAAAWYAHAYLDLDLTREETLARLDELLDLERISS